MTRDRRPAARGPVLWLRAVCACACLCAPAAAPFCRAAEPVETTETPRPPAVRAAVVMLRTTAHDPAVPVWLAPGLARAVADALDCTEGLEAIDPAEVNAALQAMKTAEDLPDLRAAKEACRLGRRAGATHVAVCLLEPGPKRLRCELRIYDVPGGREIAGTAVAVEGPRDALAEIRGRLAAAVATACGCRPTPPDEIGERAFELYLRAASTDEPARREALCSRALEIDEDFAPARRLRADARQELGRTEAALADAVYCAKRWPDRAACWSLLARCLRSRGRDVQALAAAERAVARAGRARDHLLAAEILEDLGRYDRALAAYGRARRAAGGRSFRPAVREGMLLCRLGRWNRAELVLDEALEIRSGDPAALRYRGLARYSAGRFEQAMEDLDAACRSGAEDAWTLSTRAAVHYSCRRYAEALLDYSRALKLDPTLATAAHGRGQTLAAMGEPQRALEAFDEAVRRLGERAYVFADRAAVLRELGRLEGALADYDRAIALDGDFARAYEGKGITLHRLGRLAEALVCYDRAVALSPQEAGTYQNRAITHLKIGNCEKARQDVLRCLDLGGHVQGALRAAVELDSLEIGQKGQVLRSSDR
jgi:tetratricopeptide (TPR) repeat protein